MIKFFTMSRRDSSKIPTLSQNDLQPLDAAKVNRAGIFQSPMKNILKCCLKARPLVVTCVSVILLIFLWGLSDALTRKYLRQQMIDVRQNNLSSLQELRSQVGDTLKRLNTVSDMHITQESCTAEILRQQGQLVRQWRFINEAAVRLRSGSICHSFGLEQTLRVIPDEHDANYYPTGDGKYYWFNAGPGVSADDGTVVISQGNSYLWLNKGILIDIMNLPKNISLDLVDEKTLQSRFSNDVDSVNLLRRPTFGELTFSEDRVYLSYPVKWVGTFALVSLPISAYYKVRLAAFIGLLIVSFVALFALYYFASHVYHQKLSVLANLRVARKRNQLRVNYQPIVEIHTGHWKGAEALLRWNCGDKMISPSDFIPVAEQNGMIRELTRWVCQQVAEDHATYLWACKDLYLTINLSATDIADTTFPDFVETLFKTHGVPSSRIVFEVTESSLVDKNIARVQLQRLRDLGHKIAVDDFGTGYSSLSYLQELPIDILKLDRSFLSLEKIRSADSIVWHIARLGQSLDLTVVAEGIESVEQVDALAEAGISLGQGWLYSKDLSISQLAKRFFAINVDSRKQPVI